MTGPLIKTINVKTGINSHYLENTLTTDISVLESIFDLIDNSIDAARDHLVSRGFNKDVFGLPCDYSNYKINIRLGKDSISIYDNCLGMDERTLTSHAFKTADVSKHKFGIGHYGLGLKRALLKFGGKFAMSSDNGDIAFKMRFDNDVFSGDKKLTAFAYKSAGRRKTLFVVTKIKPSVRYEIRGLAWFENAVKLLKTRYAAYTEKGLKITISNCHLNQFERADGLIPTIRTDSKFKPISRPLEIEGVNIYIDSGIHGQYYFPTEKPYSLAVNKTLTDEFGLYFICNDRVIVSSSTASEHGWKTKWHSEYNGFVCIVRFVSEDPQKIPWNTLKTALKTDGSLFVAVRDELQPIATLYRNSVKRLYPVKKRKTRQSRFEEKTSESVSLDSRSATASSLSQPTSATSRQNEGGTEASASKSQQMHPKNWDTVLPPEFPVSCGDQVLNAFIIESAGMHCDSMPCASALLLRSTLERALRQFVQKSGYFEAVKAHFYSSSEGMKKNHSEEYKKVQGIDLAMMLAWLSDEKIALTIFGVEEKPSVWLATKKAKQHAKKLNGVVHGLEFVDAVQFRTIRNEIYPLLKFCVAKN